jgi:hypothetical protein
MRSMYVRYAILRFIQRYEIAFLFFLELLFILHDLFYKIPVSYVFTFAVLVSCALLILKSLANITTLYCYEGSVLDVIFYGYHQT